MSESDGQDVPEEPPPEEQDWGEFEEDNQDTTPDDSEDSEW